MKIIKEKRADIDFIISRIIEGKVFAMPTDTSYGLLGNIKEKTVSRIYRMKKRSKEKFMPIFVSGKWVNDFAEIGEKAKKLIEKFWPGALTLIIKPRKEKLAELSAVSSSQETIAVREPARKTILSVLERYRQPLTSTSANISGKPACYSAEEILEQFKNGKLKPDYVIDGGALPKHPASTIIDTETLEIIREGELTRHVVMKKI